MDSNSKTDATDTMKPENDLRSHRTKYLSQTTPAYNGTPNAWNATEPVELQLHRSIHLVGERQDNGKLTPFKLCGYVFRRDDILSWMDSQELMVDYVGPSVNRIDCGWGGIVHALSPHGVFYRLVRAPVIHVDGHPSKKRKCAELALILGSNETKKERAATRNIKKIEWIHNILNVPMGVLGPPLWYAPAN
ncbi:hypothetical protein HYPSUDRAFT_213060 [Hypholoma sublateritium FD-334 SS-4]|uniref:Uncharacterized protein n=1 Tax=Hypholoma sublateritium (strain FD-334 SS-4) TaxID=945553 RepID=A0A0D2PEE7_HYPSF|nr:hypothetical protein HYPSUDRAFT_213060 [Hypholoma sublateritium FD-334 SS-4]